MRRGPLFRHKWFAWFTGAVGLGSIGDKTDRLAMSLLALEEVEPMAEREAEDETADV